MVATVGRFAYGIAAASVLAAFALIAGCGPQPTCSGGQMACDGNCVDPQLDPSHCGSCDHACEQGDLCSVGACAATCLAGMTACDGRCTDTKTDPENCGTCGHACGGEVCSAGSCGAACSGSDLDCNGRCVDAQDDRSNCGACGLACPLGEFCAGGTCTASNIKHVVLIVEENHTFETYFGNYCTAPAGSNPTCTSGHDCCEAAPDTEPSGSPPVVLDDMSNETKDRDHEQVCELAQIDGGAMDHYVVGSGVDIGVLEGIFTYDCSDPHNFALADQATVGPYWTYADQGALADRYFQPTVGSTSANDMYLAVAQWQFVDNDDRPFADDSGCLAPGGDAVLFHHVATIADLLIGNGYTFRIYADGYADAVAAAPLCSSQTGRFPADCEAGEEGSNGSATPYSVCNFDPADVPFEYYPQFTDNAAYIADSTQLAGDVASGQLPSFAYVKARTYANEHPKWSTISRGVDFVTGVVDLVESSQYANDTLVLVTWDEGGGFYDHVSPPAALGAQYDVDGSGQTVPYGTRVPMIAIGPFARAGSISHVQMEHSSIVRFLEHNFLGPQLAGALGHRDAAVANLGSLLDPTKTGIAIP